MNSFELAAKLNQNSEQVEFWNNRINESFVPTKIIKDYIATESHHSMEKCICSLDSEYAKKIHRLTSKNQALKTIFYSSVLLIVAHRFTTSHTPSVLVLSDPRNFGEDSLNQFTPLISNVDSDITFKDFLTHNKKIYLDSLGNSDIPLKLLFEQKGVELTDFAICTHTICSKKDFLEIGINIALTIEQKDNNIELNLFYNTDLYSEETAKILLYFVVHTTYSCLDNPQRKISELTRVTEKEREKILKLFNNTHSIYPSNKLLHQFLEDIAEDKPDAIAVLGDGFQTTYRELNSRANKLARYLRNNKVLQNTVVGICLSRSVDMLVAIYATLKAGGAYLPIDPSLPKNRIEYILENSKCKLVIVSDEARKIIGNSVHLVNVNSPSSYDWNDNNLEIVNQPNDLCYVIYTSGSTGKPKGVMVEHTSAVNRLFWMQREYSLSDKDIILHKTPFTFDVSVWELFWWSFVGASVSLLPPNEEKNPEKILEFINKYHISTIHFVPSMLNAFLDYVKGTGVNNSLFSLRWIFASGEALTIRQVELFDCVFEPSPATKLINLYGPTEATVDVSYFDCSQSNRNKSIPIGKPIDNIKLYIVDERNGLVPIGVPGELCISGVGLARGYLNNAELTRQKFIENPFEQGERLYKTGDLARWLSDGKIEYLERIDNQVKIRGYRIELGEIEYFISKFPGVKECAVTVYSNNDEKSLCAYVVSSSSVREVELREHLTESLPSYMLPQYFVFLDNIPVNHNGKRDLKQLAAPDLNRDRANFVAPSDEKEKLLAEIWSDILNVELVGVHDNFFYLGGDSIKFIAVLSRSKANGLNFTFQQLFQYPTISSLLANAALDHKNTSDIIYQPLNNFELISKSDRRRLPTDAVDAYPLSTLQAGLIYESMKSNDPSLYHDILSYRIKDSLNVSVFIKAVAILVQKHPIFRTSFHFNEYNESLQLVFNTTNSPLSIFDLTGLTPDEQGIKLREYTDLELQNRFPLGKADLVRIHVHILSEVEYQYTLSYHDAALDGWSVNNIHSELFKIYFTLLDKKVYPQEEYLVKFRDFIKLEREALSSNENEAYWLNVMNGSSFTKLPRYYKVLNGERNDVIIHDVTLPFRLSSKIKGVANKLAVPVKIVLLASHVKVLSFLTGVSDVVTGYEHSGRPEVENGDRILGLFLNTIPFRINCAGGSFADLIHKVYETEAQLLPYRRYPMAKIKQAVGNLNPLFEAVFNFTHFHVLKELTKFNGFELLRVKVDAETEFPFRAEFSQDAISDEVMFSIHYHSSEFSHAQIERIAGYYVKALTLITENLDSLHEYTNLISDEENQMLCHQFHGNAVECPSHRCYVELFEEQVAKTPNKIALSYKDMSLTYHELNSIANRFSKALLAHGVKQGEVISVGLDRGIEWAVSILAIFKIGAVYLPHDPSHPLDRISSIINKSNCRYVISNLTYCNVFNSARDQVGYEHHCTVLLFEELIRTNYSEENLCLSLSASDITYIIFTSGSTGMPKGAIIENAGMINHLYAKINDLELSGEDCIAQIATQCFDISVWQLICAWIIGGRTVIYDSETIKDAKKFIHLVNKDAITILEVVPSYLEVLVSEVVQEKIEFPKLRYVLVTGEQLKKNLTEHWFANFSIDLVNAYGPTEASDDITHFIMHEPVSRTRVPIGKPIQNTQIYVLNQKLQICPIGTFGEICVTGVCVGRGYINDYEKTSSVFIKNHLDDKSEKLYRTGDIGRWLPDGTLDCLGRVDEQVKIRGFRIELSEIENAFSIISEINNVAVLAKDIEGAKQLIAFYTSKIELDVAFIKSALSKKIPDYMLPTHIVKLDSLPLNSNGKVDKKSLLRIETKSKDSARRELLAPRNETEQLVVQLFSEVLNLGAENISVNDNFFDIGGHSLVAMKLVSKARNMFNLKDILAYPTPWELAELFNSKQSMGDELIVRLSSPDIHESVSMVCISYAGGNAVNFLPLSKELERATNRISLYGVELPGHSMGSDASELVDIDYVADICCKEIRSKIKTPIVILGHCSGTAFALKIAKQLEEQRVDLRHVFLLARVLKSTSADDFATNEVNYMSEHEIKDWLIRETGFTDVNEMSEEELSFLGKTFRHDTTQASYMFYNSLKYPESVKINSPITNIVSSDDLLTKGYEKCCANWAIFSDNVQLSVLNNGGHYFIKTLPKEVVKIIKDKLVNSLS